MKSFWNRWKGFKLGSDAKKSKQRRPQRQVRLESLERRDLMAADLRTIDGTGNNLQRPTWGSTDEQFLRMAPAEYSDGAAAPAGSDRPSARAVSNALAAQGPVSIANDRDMSAFVYAWGQFLDHDLDLTLGATPTENFAISVPTGDPYFDPLATGTKTIGLTRSIYDTTTGASAANPRQQMNDLTAFVDGSMVYGSDDATAASLRTFSGGLLKTSAGNLLPTDANGQFLAGDIRVNENPELQSLQTLFLREHNRIAAELATANPSWTDEQLYQQARRRVIGEIQAITYNEFLPALLGQNALKPYRGYNPNVNPGIANEFATAAYRVGHTMVGPDIEFLDNNGNPVREEVALRDAFFNTSLITETDIDPVLKYLASDHSQEIDTMVIDDLRNFLFGPPGSGGLDLAALNIQRGRDHGLADYNATRVAYGLRPVRDFADITSDVAVQNALRSTYGNVNNIDLWVGGLAETHAPGASVGPLFQRIIADQFQRLRDGDRFYFERDFKGPELAQIRSTTLADVIQANTSLTNIQDNVFFFKAGINGRVTVADSPGGRAGIAGVTVQLQDAEGTIIATAITNKHGEYHFDSLDLGTYRVRIQLPSGLTQTSPDPVDVVITSGDTLANLNFTASRTKAPAPRETPPRPPVAPSAPLNSSVSPQQPGGVNQQGTPRRS